MNIYQTREGTRLQMNRQHEGHWNRWGPYLAERAWGTVREDYSKDGDAWSYFPTITRARAPIAGMKTALPASATVTNICASRSRFGIRAIRS